MIFYFVTSIALIFAIISPPSSLLWCPILFGPAHIIGDLWLLVAKPGLVKFSSRLLILITSTGIILLNACQIWHQTAYPLIDSIMLSALLIIPSLFSSTGKILNYLVLPALLLSIFLFVPSVPIRGVVAHLHNIIAIIFLFISLKTKNRKILRPVVYISILLVMLAVCSAYTKSVFGVSIDSPYLQPFLGLTMGASGNLACFLLCSFAVFQIVHFAAWIIFLPKLNADAGVRWWILVLALFFLGIILVELLEKSAIANPVLIRQSYLALVSFHGWMEISWLFVRTATLAREGKFKLENLFLLEANTN